MENVVLCVNQLSLKSSVELKDKFLLAVHLYVHPPVKNATHHFALLFVLKAVSVHLGR